MSRTLWALVLALVLPSAVQADDWPEWLGPKRDGIWRETGLVQKFPKDGPRILWRVPMGQGYSGPAVVGDRVFVMDRLRATDSEGKPLRATRDGIPGKERVLCLDANSGKIIWKHEYDCSYRVSYPSGPRVTPLVRAGRVYTLGTMGDLYCLDAQTGKPVWHNNLVKSYDLGDPPVWGYAASLLLDGDLVYTLAGGPGSGVVALNKDTGKQVWKALTSDEVGYSAPTLVTSGGKRQLIVWLSDSLNGLNPTTGEVYWTLEYPVGRAVTRPSVTIVTPVPHGNLLLVSSAYHGMMAVELDAKNPAAKVLWYGKSDRLDKTDGLHSVMATPVVKDGHIYGTCSLGELRCLDVQTGKRVWETLDLTGGEKAFCGTAFLVPQGDRYLAFNDQGELILAELNPKGHKVIDKARILDPVERVRGRIVVWSHPAFARRCVFARNDKEMVCVSLAEKS
jgi:outer membrane protein assembly factor BamB